MTRLVENVLLDVNHSTMEKNARIHAIFLVSTVYVTEIPAVVWRAVNTLPRADADVMSYAVAAV